MAIRKKIIVAILIFGACSLGVGVARDPVQIFGSLAKARVSSVTLFKVEEGAIVEIAQSRPNKHGLFGFTFYPDYEGLYVLGTGNASGPRNNFKFWFKPGDQLMLNLSDTGYTLQGDVHSPENRILTEWHRIAREMEWKSFYFMQNQSDYRDFFPVLERTLEAAGPWLSAQRSGNPRFDRTLGKIVALDMAYGAVHYLHTPRSVHPDAAVLPVYYRTLSTPSLFRNTEDVYSYPWGKRALSTQLLRDQIAEAVRPVSEEEALRMQLARIDNDTLKGDVVLDYAAHLRDYANYLELKTQFGPYMLTESQRARALEIEVSLATWKPGDPGIEFAYVDNQDKKVSFNDFRGKVVLIDVWATWCGPCRAEFPHLRRLHEEMEGQDVVFMGLSTDAEKDREKWKQMIVDEQLGGVQLFAGKDNTVSQYYKITSIPRFMVFDQEGKIVTIDAPRPSDPALKALLEKVLAGL